VVTQENVGQGGGDGLEGENDWIDFMGGGVVAVDNV
jgi:hypothetical protein